MKANELRIGNYVIQDVEFIRGISSMSLHKFNLDLIKLIPIPLTEEWILKFGFEKKLTVWWYFNEKLVIECGILSNKIFVRFRLNDYESVEISEIKYVHQLQNLYFALTNEELKYEL